MTVPGPPRLVDPLTKPPRLRTFSEYKPRSCRLYQDGSPRISLALASGMTVLGPPRLTDLMTEPPRLSTLSEYKPWPK
ncbi:UNVERIFIED_CONTAM: hypothetical protein Sradi_6556000 [Sesamum radiatum]|uniref:Uncharacterized protein n=1 Tax=Sesamum radiatum TaxID=300843 RepID=A0AAW2JX56_SESRA